MLCEKQTEYLAVLIHFTTDQICNVLKSINRGFYYLMKTAKNNLYKLNLL